MERKIERNAALRGLKPPGRAPLRLWNCYHDKSCGETKKPCVKLLSKRVMARDFDRRFGKFQVRFAALNGQTNFGIPVTKVVV